MSALALSTQAAEGAHGPLAPPVPPVGCEPPCPAIPPCPPCPPDPPRPPDAVPPVTAVPPEPPVCVEPPPPTWPPDESPLGLAVPPSPPWPPCPAWPPCPPVAHGSQLPAFELPGSGCDELEHADTSANAASADMRKAEVRREFMRRDLRARLVAQRGRSIVRTHALRTVELRRPPCPITHSGLVVVMCTSSQEVGAKPSKLPPSGLWVPSPRRSKLPARECGDAKNDVIFAAKVTARMNGKTAIAGLLGICAGCIPDLQPAQPCEPGASVAYADAPESLKTPELLAPVATYEALAGEWAVDVVCPPDKPPAKSLHFTVETRPLSEWKYWSVCGGGGEAATTTCPAI